jgi:hypothetical protein
MLDPDVKPTVYCSGLRSGSQATWNSVLNKYGNTTSETDKAAIIQGLGCVENEILDSYLMMSIEGDQIRPRDREAVIRSAISSGPFGIERVLIFLINEFPQLQTRLVSFRLIWN